MLRINASANATQAKNYFKDALSKNTGEYYTKTLGQWHGKAAKMLGLSGDVTKEAFYSLIDNKHPDTGERLTLRNVNNRRPGYDMTWDVPKSVSLVYALTQDKTILDAFRASVQETMQEIEQEMQTGNLSLNNITGNAVWAEFVEFTSRPTKDLNTGKYIACPQLHCHAYVLNATWDKNYGEKGAWKAVEVGNIKRDAPYYQAACNARLAKRLTELGYGIEQRPDEKNRLRWEIAGINRPLIEKFSLRMQEIEEAAKKLGIISDKAKGELGARTRQNKGKAEILSDEQLRRIWYSWITPEEKQMIRQVSKRQYKARPAMNEAQALSHAIERAFERVSVMDKKRLMALALEYGVSAVLPEDIKRQVKEEHSKNNLIIREKDHRAYCTTRQALNEEKHIIDFARYTKGTCKPLGSGEYQFKRGFLNSDQRAAIQHILNSTDRIIAVSGGAGTGKTTAMQEAVEAGNKAGKKVYAFAPSADASRGTLRKDGFSDANTVAALLTNEQLQQQLKNQIIWIDEAGLLGVKDMKHLFDIAEQYNARIILTGDRHQHRAVMRGDILGVLEDYAGITPAKIQKIQRQTGHYKKAVSAISKGQVEEGFSQLDKLGYIEEIENSEQRYRQLASNYWIAKQQGKSVLVVSPTHAEKGIVTDAIRDRLRKEGDLSTEERIFTRLNNLSWTEAERKESVYYQPGLTVQFVKSVKGSFKRGERVTVARCDEYGVWVKRSSGTVVPLPLDKAETFQVCKSGQIGISAGDAIRITQNGVTQNRRKGNYRKHELNNGAIYEVKGFTKSGDIELTNGFVISKDYANLDYGYCSTSHSSQGKTVDRVFIAQSSTSFTASSREQFYVSVSRGRECVTIYTDDKKELLQAVTNSGQQMSATELLYHKNKPNDLLTHAMLIARLKDQAIAYASRAVEIGKSWSEKVIDETKAELAKRFARGRPLQKAASIERSISQRKIREGREYGK